MIRGAFILAAGFLLGYTKAIQETDEIRDVLVKLGNDLKDAVDNSADKTYPQPADVEGKAVEDDLPIEDPPTDYTQGERS